MRNLQECQAEVFRRSEKRIHERKKRRAHLLMLCIPLALCITIIGAYLFPKGDQQPISDISYEPMVPDGLFAGGGAMATCAPIDFGKYSEDGATAMGTLGSFSFSLTWDVYGISSYDSTTGRLVKTTDASTPEDYIAIYYLTEAEKQEIYNLIASLDITSYPDSYDPHEGELHSKPSMTLILSVKTNALKKTVTAENIALTYEAENPEGQHFLSVCKEIRDILIGTDEWKSLPDYEFYYD